MPSVYLSGSVQEKNATVLPGKTEESIMQEFARNIALAIQRKTDQIEIYLNQPEWTLDQVIADSNRRKPDLHVALHSNAGGGTGTETWAWPAGTNSFAFAILLQDKVVDALGLPDRGVKDGRHLAEVKKTNSTAVLMEVFFHDNLSDMATFRANYEAVRDAARDAVIEWFGIKQEESELTKLRRFKADVLELIKKYGGEQDV